MSFVEIMKMLLTSFFPLALLILAVLGAILFGLATPTEAASIGALGGLVLAVAYRALTWKRRCEERRVGKECSSTCRSRWWTYNSRTQGLATNPTVPIYYKSPANYLL